MNTTLHNADYLVLELRVIKYELQVREETGHLDSEYYELCELYNKLLEKQETLANG